MTTLSSQIKALRSNLGFSQKELANILKVSQTSIAHYELGNRQPTIETLIAMSTLFNVSIDILVGRPLNTNEHYDMSDPTRHISHMIALLINKDSIAFKDYLLLISNHMPLCYILESLIAETQNQLGLMWEKGEITVADEHYATNIIRKTMQHLFASIEPTVPNKRAISMTVHADQHTLGMELVSEFLEKRGIKTLYLGGNVPTSSLNLLIEDYRPDYLFISITHPDHIDSLILLIDSIHSHNPKFEIILGGQAIQHMKNVPFNNANVTLIDKIDQLLEKLGLSQ